MGTLRRLTASWTFFWAVNGALLVSALAVGLATAGGRLRLRTGLVIIAFLLGVVAVQCYRALREWTLRKRARPLAQKGFELGRQGRSEEAIAAYDEFLARWGGTDEDALHWLVAMVLVNRAIRLEGLGRFEEAISSCDEVLYRFGRSSRPDVREHVAKALGTKGVALGKLGRLEEAIAIYDEVAHRFDRAWEPDIVVNRPRFSGDSAVWICPSVSATLRS
jgi:tetratricopeptide (TPR) repeat protein